VKPAAAWVCSQIEEGILCSAALLTPGEQRAEWLREWRGELWHAREATRFDKEITWEGEKTILRFCSGSIQDAFAMRKLRGAQSAFRGSAVECLLLLLAMFMASCLLYHVLPEVRAQNHPSLYQVNSNLIMIQDAFASSDSLATIPVEKYRMWKSRQQRYFDGFAFYHLTKENVATQNAVKQRWKVAHGSLNLFWMLGLPTLISSESPDAEGRTPGIILSDAIWRRDFQANLHVSGHIVHVGHDEFRVLGVAPLGVWRLPGNVDAWVLEPDEENRGVGYVIAHLTALGRSQMSANRIEIVSSNSDDSNEELCGISFANRTKGPWGFFQFALFLAFLALPAITSVSFGESQFCSNRPSWTNRVFRWMFLCAKIALLLPTVYFASLDLAYWHAPIYSVGAQYVQLISSFTMGLFGLRWILLDQRNRCPVCLRRVTHPAQVGLTGRTFLAWNGTELICTGGHTLLHVPAMPTSWFSTQRWLYLDSSWKSLFVVSSSG